MAPQGVVHLQNASFWRAHKSELEILGILVHQFEFDASGYWQPVQADEERCDMGFLRLVEDLPREHYNSPVWREQELGQGVVRRALIGRV